MSEAPSCEVPASVADPLTDHQIAAAKGEPVQSKSTQPKTTEPSAINFKIKLILILIAISIVVNLILAACGLGLAIQAGGKVDQVQKQSDIYYNLIKSLRANSTILLVGGTRSSGRVEILHDGLWGTICDDIMDFDAGNLMCRLLGFNHASDMHCCAKYGQGKGPIWLDRLECSRNSLTFEDCSHAGWGSSSCNHDEDLSITCK